MEDTTPITGRGALTDTTRFGRDDAGRYVKGMFDEVRIYSRALTATEIAEIHADPTAVITADVSSRNEYAPRDNNRVPVMMAVDSTDATKVLPVYVNPDTGAVLIETN